MSHHIFSSPYVWRFEHLEQSPEGTAKAASDSYPSHNIEQTGPERLRIVLALVGFAPDDLNVTVEENELIIGGRQTERPGKAFLQRGAAARRFQRAFVLVDRTEVAGAELNTGLLSIKLARPQPESVTRRIDTKVENSNGREGDRL